MAEQTGHSVVAVKAQQSDGHQGSRLANDVSSTEAVILGVRQSLILLYEPHRFAEGMRAICAAIARYLRDVRPANLNVESPAETAVLTCDMLTRSSSSLPLAVLASALIDCDRSIRCKDNWARRCTESLGDRGSNTA